MGGPDPLGELPGFIGCCQENCPFFKKLSDPLGGFLLNKVMSEVRPGDRVFTPPCQVVTQPCWWLLFCSGLIGERSHQLLDLVDPPGVPFDGAFKSDGQIGCCQRRLLLQGSLEPVLELNSQPLIVLTQRFGVSGITELDVRSLLVKNGFLKTEPVVLRAGRGRH